ncbi:hypothetical protein HYE20_03770 [Mycoplasmopsis bovis]|nr:hypothetical protein [Mycoplasmopsis bovis]QQH24679.1 hypothetical protein HYE20_03770 [Mycoplasmopsis bovis]
MTWITWDKNYPWGKDDEKGNEDYEDEENKVEEEKFDKEDLEEFKKESDKAEKEDEKTKIRSWIRHNGKGRSNQAQCKGPS